MANDFLQFAGGGGANVLSQSAYAALTTILASGYSAGTALSPQLNKTWRQSSAMACAWGGIVDAAGFSALDDGNIANLRTAITNALKTICLPLAGGTTTGDVGIGTVTGTAAATTSRLKVKQASASRGIVIEQNGANDSNLRFHMSGTEAQIMASYSTTGSYQPLALFTSDVKRVHIAVSGEVGIGMVPAGGVALDVTGQIQSTRTGANFRAVNATANGAGSLGANAGAAGGATLSGEAGPVDIRAGSTDIARWTNLGLKIGNNSNPSGALEVEGLGLIKAGNTLALRVLSGAIGDYTGIGIGRTAPSDLQVVVAAVINNFISGSAPGDAIIQAAAAAKLWLASGSNAAVSIDNLMNVLVRKGGGSANLADFNTQSIGASGYQALPGGLILQWGRTSSIAAGGGATITLPLAFPNANRLVMLIAETTGGSAQAHDNVTARTLTNFTMGNSANVACVFGWFAIGN